MEGQQAQAVIGAMGILTIVALLVGPVIGVGIARWIDVVRSKRERRMEIFRTLMRTRRSTMWPDHVGALNLVEIEFQDVPSIIKSWKDLFTHLGQAHPRKIGELTNDNMEKQERDKRDDEYGIRLQEERQKLLAKLLHSIAKNLGFKIEQLDIFEGDYTPQGWDDIDLEQRAIRFYTLQLLRGKRTLPIGVIDYTKSNDSQIETTEPDDDSDTPTTGTA